ncbi:MAG: 4Fe-4S dicluster domain-containing protein [Desulfobacteraceae bacterium]|nr:4Fe-4S dicluster domain-containing protein [Desulfobacteraceae bacterium]
MNPKHSFPIKRLKIAGQPEHRIEAAPAPGEVAAMPERIPLLKARLRVDTGDRVKIGTPLYEDKENTDIVFASPAGGQVVDIRYGPRRVIREIVIQTEKAEEHEDFGAPPGAELSRTTRPRLVQILLNAGMWPLFRDIVYRSVADPAETPAAIWVAMDNLDPFHPPPEIYLSTPADLRQFKTGLHALNILCEHTHVCKSAKSADLDAEIENRVTHRVRGAYPAEDPGVVHFHNKTTTSENRGWFIRGQDVVLLGEFLETGSFPTRRIAAVSGADIESRYVSTRIGAPLHTLISGVIEPDKYRWVTGGLFRGYSGSIKSYLGLYETGLFLITESNKRELFGFMRPGTNKPTCSRTFLSIFNPKPLSMDADMHGAKRACVNCGNCTRVCPVNILPQFTYKCIRAGEIEEALSHGLLDCVECGLCSYVCPSKIELCHTFQETRHAYFRERI